MTVVKESKLLGITAMQSSPNLRIRLTSVFVLAGVQLGVEALEGLGRPGAHSRRKHWTQNAQDQAQSMRVSVHETTRRDVLVQSTAAM